jgi:hypothetical protein
LRNTSVSALHPCKAGVRRWFTTSVKLNLCFQDGALESKVKMEDVKVEASVESPLCGDDDGMDYGDDGKFDHQIKNSL